MLTEKTIVDQIEVTELNAVQVRMANLILKDGVEIARTYHRYALLPKDDLTGKDPKIIAVANAVWK